MKLKKVYYNVLTSIFIAACIGGPIFAQDHEARVLTLEKAIELGRGNNSQVGTYSKLIDYYEERMKYSNNGSLYETDDAMYDLKDTEQKREFLKETIGYDVTNEYNNLIILQKELDLLEDQIAYTEKVLRNAEIKNKMGMLDEVSYDKEKLNLSEYKNQQINKTQMLKEANYTFKILTGVDPSSYTLEESFEYEPFKLETSVDAYISTLVDKAYKYQEEAADFYDATMYMRLDEGQDYRYSTYLQLMANAYSNKASVKQGKESAKENLLSVYTNLRKSETELESLKEQLTVKEKEVKVTEIKHKAGFVSAVEYERVILEYNKLKLDIITTINACNNFKASLETPWSVIGVA